MKSFFTSTHRPVEWEASTVVAPRKKLGSIINKRIDVLRRISITVKAKGVKLAVPRRLYGKEIFSHLAKIMPLFQCRVVALLLGSLVQLAGYNLTIKDVDMLAIELNDKCLLLLNQAHDSMYWQDDDVEG